MRVYIKGHPVQLLFRYVEREINKKTVQPGLLVQLRAYGEPGTTRIVYGESLHFVDSRDKFDKVRARREGLVDALDDACRREGWGREERLAVWEVYQSCAKTLGHERFPNTQPQRDPYPDSVYTAFAKEIERQRLPDSPPLPTAPPIRRGGPYCKETYNSLSREMVEGWRRWARQCS